MFLYIYNLSSKHLAYEYHIHQVYLFLFLLVIRFLSYIYHIYIIIYLYTYTVYTYSIIQYMHKNSGAHGGGDTGGSGDDDSLLSQWSQSDDIHVVFWDFRWAGTSASTVFFLFSF